MPVHILTMYQKPTFLEHKKKQEPLDTFKIKLIIIMQQLCYTVN